MLGAPAAAGESYLHGEGILCAVVTCPRCGGDHTAEDEDYFGYATLWRCQTCDEGVVPVDELAERLARPAEMARDDGPSFEDW